MPLALNSMFWYASVGLIVAPGTIHRVTPGVQTPFTLLVPDVCPISKIPP